MYLCKMSETTKEFRKRNSISQLQLANEVLCDSVTISNIETESFSTEYTLYSKIASKLKIPVSLHKAITENNLQRLSLEHEIHLSFDNNIFFIADKLIKYKNIPEVMSPSEKQFYLYAKSVFLIYNAKKINLKNILNDLYSAIKITFNTFNFNIQIQNHIFTGLEFLILIYIGKIIGLQNNFKDSEKIFFQLFNFFNSSDIDTPEFTKIFILLCQEYSNILINLNKHSEAQNILCKALTLIKTKGFFNKLEPVYDLLLKTSSNELKYNSTLQKVIFLKELSID